MSKNALNLGVIGDASESLKAKRKRNVYLSRKQKFTNLAFFAEKKNAFTSHDRALIHMRKLNF